LITVNGVFESGPADSQNDYGHLGSCCAMGITKALLYFVDG